MASANISSYLQGVEIFMRKKAVSTPNSLRSLELAIYLEIYKPFSVVYSPLSPFLYIAEFFFQFHPRLYPTLRYILVSLLAKS